MKKIIALFVILGVVFFGGCGAIVGGVAGGLFGGHPGTAQEGFEAGLEKDFGITPSMKVVDPPSYSTPVVVEVPCGNNYFRCTKDYYGRKNCGYVWISRPCGR